MARSALRAPGVGLLTLLLATCAPPDPQGPRLYVTSGFTDEVLILDPSDGSILASREIDRRPEERDEPHGVAVAPDGRHWYVTLSHGEPSLWKFETEGDRRVGRLDLPLNGAGRVALDPDGRRAIVTDYWLGGLGQPSEVAVVELESMEVVYEAEVCPAPHHAAWSPSGDRIAVTCALSDEIVVLDGDGYEPLRRFPVALNPDGTPAQPGNPIAQPMNLAWKPDGTAVYVTLLRLGAVAAFTLDGRAEWVEPTGEGPAQIALTPDGTHLAVAHRGPSLGGVAWMDAATGSSTFHPLAEVLHPHGIALSPDGAVAYVTYEGSTSSAGGVLALDPVTGERLWHTPAGVFTLGVALLPGL